MGIFKSDRESAKEVLYDLRRTDRLLEKVCAQQADMLDNPSMDDLRISLNKRVEKLEHIRARLQKRFNRFVK